MPTELPYAADAEESLSFDELEVLRLQYQKELAQGHVTVQTKFNYAWGLVKSPMREHQAEGVRLLQGAHTEIYRAEPTRRRECLYYLALGHYKMGNYEEARRFNALLLDKEPSNLQAQSLAGLIDQRVTRGTLPSSLPLFHISPLPLTTLRAAHAEGYIGMAIVGGVAALSTLALATIIRRASRK
ncbi:hypothetical protein BN946_scf185008.g37 [Trametes cinnabarina]|uniref:Mitochondrial fission 1 protein n=1 Tax=Pycnoporus cinnabarinus TaxID=5643 RepID=A0A060SFX9_PYCCI|nr:hypothetical protein BN946_scf185008.g37 [Trametes cinnabarina]